MPWRPRDLTNRVAPAGGHGRVTKSARRPLQISGLTKGSSSPRRTTLTRVAKRKAKAKAAPPSPTPTPPEAEGEAEGEAPPLVLRRSSTRGSGRRVDFAALSRGKRSFRDDDNDGAAVVTLDPLPTASAAGDGFLRSSRSSSRPSSRSPARVPPFSGSAAPEPAPRWLRAHRPTRRRKAAAAAAGRPGSDGAGRSKQDQLSPSTSKSQVRGVITSEAIVPRRRKSPTKRAPAPQPSTQPAQAPPPPPPPPPAAASAPARAPAPASRTASPGRRRRRPAVSPAPIPPMTPSPRRKQKKVKVELYCICNTPYDDTREYVACDTCSAWFHLECVGLDCSAAALQFSSFECSACAKKAKRRKAGRPGLWPERTISGPRSSSSVLQRKLSAAVTAAAAAAGGAGKKREKMRQGHPATQGAAGGQRAAGASWGGPAPLMLPVQPPSLFPALSREPSVSLADVQREAQLLRAEVEAEALAGDARPGSAGAATEYGGGDDDDDTDLGLHSAASAAPTGLTVPGMQSRASFRSTEAFFTARHDGADGGAGAASRPQVVPLGLPGRGVASTLPDTQETLSVTDSQDLSSLAGSPLQARTPRAVRASSLLQLRQDAATALPTIHAHVRGDGLAMDGVEDGFGDGDEDGADDAEDPTVIISSQDLRVSSQEAQAAAEGLAKHLLLNNGDGDGGDWDSPPQAEDDAWCRVRKENSDEVPPSSPLNLGPNLDPDLEPAARATSKQRLSFSSPPLARFRGFERLLRSSVRHSPAAAAQDATAGPKLATHLRAAAEAAALGSPVPLARALAPDTWHGPRVRVRAREGAGAGPAAPGSPIFRYVFR